MRTLHKTLAGFSASTPDEIKPFADAFVSSKTMSQKIRLACVHNSYQFVKGGFLAKVKSPEFDMAEPFKNGYARVLSNNETAYIDENFNYVLLDSKLRTFDDLFFLIIKAPNSVATYISPERFHQLLDSVKIDLILPDMPDKQRDSVEKRVNVAENFAAAKNIVHPHSRNTRTSTITVEQ